MRNPDSVKLDAKSSSCSTIFIKRRKKRTELPESYDDLNTERRFDNGGKEEVTVVNRK